MYEKILVPLDGSELAEVTLWYAARLTGRLRAALTLLYVSPPDDFTSPHVHEFYLESVAARVKADAEKVAAEAKGGNVSIDYKILKGDPAEEIIDYAEKAKIDLIILSTQGKSGIKRWPLGNVANKVVGATRTQVLLIRAKGTQPDVFKEKLTKVLVPIDGSEKSESILKFVSRLASELDLDISILHMWTRIPYKLATSDVIKAEQKSINKAKAYAGTLGTKLKEQGLRINVIFKEISSGEEAAEIIKLSEEGKFSMVAMTTHSRSGLGRWIFGSVANKVLYEGHTPLLLVRP